jgi:CRISPR-associated Csx14 family protein
LSNIVIATLGESPIVVTGMFLKVKEQIGTIDKMIVLHPEGEWIPKGYRMIEEVLKDECSVEPWMLPFEDADTEEETYTFLRELFSLLSLNQSSEDTVYLSLAGGRKNMSALMALAVPFFPRIKKLYHLLDLYEHTSHYNFKSIQTLWNITNPLVRKRTMLPPSKDLILVEIPFGPQQQVSDEFLEKLPYFTSQELERMWETEPRKAEIIEFYRWFDQPNTPWHILPVFVTADVKNEYEGMRIHNVPLAANFATCFEYMQSPMLLKGAIHDSQKGTVSGKTFHYHFYKREGNTTERVFYHTEQGDIYSYPSNKIPVERVIISGLAKHKTRTVYEPTREELLERTLKAQKEIDAGKQELWPVESLFPKDSILLVPLGTSPMIATQLYVLLKKRFGRIIHEIILFYPEEHEKLRTSATLVVEAFEGMPVVCTRVRIPGLRDIDSTFACETYQRTLEEKIREVRNKHPYWSIDLALSGGRKGMTAMAMFAAQKAGLRYLYHTLISDKELDQKVQHETDLKILNGGISKKESHSRLFLDAYRDNLDNFTLFKVPVVPARES